MIDPVEQAYQDGLAAGAADPGASPSYVRIDTVGLLRHAQELDALVDKLAGLRHRALMLRTPLLRDPEAGSADSKVDDADDALQQAQQVMSAASRQTRGLASGFLRLERTLPGQRVPALWWEQLVDDASSQTWETEYELAKGALSLIYGPDAAKQFVGMAGDASDIAALLGMAHDGATAVSERILMAELEGLTRQGQLEAYFKKLDVPLAGARQMRAAVMNGKATTIAELTAVLTDPRSRAAVYQGMASGSIRTGLALSPARIAQALNGMDFPAAGALRVAGSTGRRVAGRVVATLARRGVLAAAGNVLIMVDINTLLFDPDQTNRAVAGISLGGMGVAAVVSSGAAGGLIPGPGWAYLAGSIASAGVLIATGAYYQDKQREDLAAVYESSYKLGAQTAYLDQLAADVELALAQEMAQTSAAPAAVAKVNAWRQTGTHFPPQAVYATSTSAGAR